MTETGRTINGWGNLLCLISLIAATVIGIIAIFQQPWLWWQHGLAVCAISLLWSALITAFAQSIKIP